MKCEELLKALGEYMDGEIAPSLCRGFEEHLAGCEPCQVVIDNVRKTISLFKAGRPYEMPEEFGSRLRRSLRDAWKGRQGRAAGR